MEDVSSMNHSQLRTHRQRKLEEAVKRLNMSKGVYGVLVTTEKWITIDSTFDHNLTHFWRKQMKLVEHLGTAVIRDSDPKNDLQFLRIQTTKFEILLSIAKDHRVLVVFSGTVNEPLAEAVKRVRHQREVKRERRKAGKKTRSVKDPCFPHTRRVGGDESVIITEKISGKEVSQNEVY